MGDFENPATLQALVSTWSAQHHITAISASMLSANTQDTSIYAGQSLT
jgi:hypothetical protein